MPPLSQLSSPLFAESSDPEEPKVLPTVTVITSTIGRPELRQCIESVRSQTYQYYSRVRHMVFVNGPRFHAGARAVLSDFPEVHSFYLQEETGDYGGGPGMADVFTSAPFLTRSDWILFLDDDNFYDPSHIESLITLATRHDLKWAYSLTGVLARYGRP